MLDRKVPSSRYGAAVSLNVREEGYTRRFITSDEYERPAPARCVHGRAVDGACILGFGMQRDAFGVELPAEQRLNPVLPTYYQVWESPLNFSERVGGDPRTYDLR